MSKSLYIQSKDARTGFEEAKKWYKPYDEPINEFERLQRNRPSDKIDPSLPKVTDGTLAAINQEGPKRVVQQTPTGLAESKDHPEYAPIANHLLTNKLIPMSQRMGSELQKSWVMIQQAGAIGSCTAYSFYTSCNGEMYVDWILPYAKDLYGEKGKTFLPDCNVRYMRSWYQRTDLKAIINREAALEKKDKNYKSDWDLKLLADFMENGASAKTHEDQTPAEREKGIDSGGYEVIHCFQKGVDAEFYSFCPRYKDGAVLRTKVNKDPRGKMPLDDMYWNIDHSNPRGRGQIELSGGVQNLIDQQLQLFQFGSTYQQAPALKVWGTVNKASLKIRMNSIWDMGTNPANKVERDVVDNAAIANFVPNMQFLQSKIYNLNSSQDNSIAASNGDVNQSKTQAGVKASEAKLGVSDNYVRKQFEEAWGNMSETRLNILMSEMTGSATMELKPDDLKAILKTPAAQFIGEKNGKAVLNIPYKDIEKVAFSFSVDAGSSEIKENNDNAEKLTQVLGVLKDIPSPEIQQKLPKLVKVLVDEIGAEGTDDLFPELDESNGQPQQPMSSGGPDPAMIQQMVQQAVQEAMAQKPQEDPMLKIFKELPEDAKLQVLQKYGLQSQSESPTERKLDIEDRKLQADTVLRADKQAHDTEMALVKHETDQQQTEFNNAQADRSSSLSEAQAIMSARQAEQAREDAKNKPVAAGVK